MSTPTKKSTKKPTTKKSVKSTTKNRKSKTLTLRSILIALALCAWTAFSFYAAAFLASLVLYLIPGANSEIPFWSAFFDLLLYCVDFFILAYLPFYLQKLFIKHKRQRSTVPELTTPTRDSLGLTGTPTWTDLGLAPLGFVIYYIGATLITVLLAFFPWFNATEAQSIGFDTYVFGVDRFFAFLAIVVIAPIGEELTFRGWLYPKLRARLGVVLAVILTSLLFALLHGQLNVAADVFVLSVIMCLFREFTGTIYASILLHILKNFIAFFLVFVLQMT